MASSSPSPSSEETQQRQEQQVKECVHKTKFIQFLGRTTPIVLQNDNGPCPLLAICTFICNVLLLRNNLNLSSDTVEVSQEKLLSLVAERLIDSNSNFNNKDAGYVENQQQNIADAIDLLPRLATGIDVNIKFRRIDDFEFTPECAIFDLLDIPLYHGWIVDPQDSDTSLAIGSKSYNALTGELVALEMHNMEAISKINLEEDCVDFAAATTATLGVPSPCLSKATSFNDSPCPVTDYQKARKGDLEEEAELLRALKQTEAEMPTSVGDSLLDNINGGTQTVRSYESVCLKDVMPVDELEKCAGVKDNNFPKLELSAFDDCNARSNGNDLISLQNNTRQAATSSLRTDVGVHLDRSAFVESEESTLHTDVFENNGVDTLLQSGTASLSPGREAASFDESDMGISRGGEVRKQSTFTTNVHESADKLGGGCTEELSCLSSPSANSDLPIGRIQHINAAQALSSSVDGSEPIYEGEECILESRNAVLEDREPVYEGEMVLKSTIDDCSPRSKDEITPQQGELIRSFLKNNASQLTINGLFCLRDGLKERELCVFFRNNHFSAMFKLDGELYLLATDQGYINQPDLVWEKLNEVNGNTLFMTGNFKEFNVESRSNDTWDEHNALTSTADFLATINSSAQADMDANSDLQLAIALQQQEFEQQPQRQNLQQPSGVGGSSRLITGPQVARNNGRNPYSSPSPKPEAKSKEKCTVM
ncbi:hypothetical protein I3843_12G099300 [Carya illinoinensis]|nr:hypothetical protein I3843_12G099300 [Carya illinoinensis]